MENKYDAFIRAFPVTWILTALISVLIYFLGGTINAVSFALGSVTTLMMMSMLNKTSNKVFFNEQDKVQAQRQIVKNYAIRYFFYALILTISAIHPNINVLFVGLGLFVFRISLYIILFITMRGDKK